ncbi:MAG: UvrD-helicase domain-containing protein [Chitinophagaceae bacterium]|nr:UvrD-helicase domain-containing protein [Chitinophagaceae bacterium]
MTAFVNKEVRRQIQALYQRGGQFQKAADTMKALLYDITNKDNDPIKVIDRLPMTNHGETRIKHCIKYDLPGFARLVTIRDNGWLVLLYLGSHDEVDKWLTKNTGLQVGVKDVESGLFEVFTSEDIKNEEARINPESDFSGGYLYLKLKHFYHVISSNLPSLIKKAFERFDSATEEDEILEAALAVPDSAQQDMLFDVFILLRGGLVDEAKNRILAYQEQLTLIADLKVEEIKEVKSNDQYLNLDDIDASDLRILMDNKDWLEWMLFMHPAQKTVVERDFKGSARLLGVSGSGKTCVVVRRAVRLAQKYPNEMILILTLNQSLSNLINNLIDKLLDLHHLVALKEKIVVKSFWELCKECILELGNNPMDFKILGRKTDKHEENIDEIWDEYYLCKNHNSDADVLFPLHQTLLVRGIFPPEYLKQELDWIRSFIPFGARDEYLKIDREGRSIGFNDKEREAILQGLKGWEDKMLAVGAIDYLGLTNEMFKWIELIKPKFRCILVDEVQDFGTLELSIIRNLAEEKENDLFLTGDIAQQVYSKHHKIRNAGITILPDAYIKILKNYRNSREILAAAYEVFKQNTSEEQFKTEDFEILKPEYANFSSPLPFLRKGASLSEELSYSIKYLSQLLGHKEKACICICGCSIYQVQQIGHRLELPVLDEDTTIGEECIYLSDLEQTKGFEFDRMIVVNANASVFPNPKLPKDEWYREISKLYVAMTRAKKELVISYSSQLSQLFENCKEFFNEDLWSDHISGTLNVIELPNSEKNTLPKSQAVKMLGKDFLYHKRSVGISRELQLKLIELVQGKSISLSGKKIGWINMDELKNDVVSKRDLPHLTRIFGSTVFKELETVLTANEDM